MKPTKTQILGCLVIAGSSILLTGCPKTTGGGWFLSYDEYDDAEIPVSFGFVARPTEELTGSDMGNTVIASGRFTLVAHHLDHTLTRVNSEVEVTWAPQWDDNPEWAHFGGTCSVDGIPGFSLDLDLRDLGEPGPSAGDGIRAFITAPDIDPLYFLLWEGYLEGGNIRIHTDSY